MPNVILLAVGLTLSAALPADPILPGGLPAQAADRVDRPQPSRVAPADSSDLRDRARDAQARFERRRMRESPLTWSSSGGRCDERVGRMCIRLTGGDVDADWAPPEEDARVVEARMELLGVLREVGEAIPGDAWVLGQRVAYLGEADQWDTALALTRECLLPQSGSWWCGALEGLALHSLDRFVEAEVAFDRSLSGLPPDLAEEWHDLEPLVEGDLRGMFRSAEGDSLRVLSDRLWTLADPLYLVPGNDRRTEHLARHTLARIRSDARNPYGMRWGGDLSEILVRYGPEIGFQQERPPPLNLGPVPMVGRFDPRSRRFVPLVEHFLDPHGVAPGSWTATERRARARHVPSYAPRVGALEVQQARFLRGDDLLLVLGWSVERAPVESSDGPAVLGDSESTGRADDGLDAGLFLLSGEDLLRPGREFEVTVVEAGIPVAELPGAVRGVAVGRVPAGPYLVSLELFDESGDRAWRARHGVVQDSLPRDVVLLSDLLLLEPENDPPIDGDGVPDVEATDFADDDALEAHFERALPAPEVAPGKVEVAWEVYGLTGEEEILGFHLGAAPEDPGLLRRAGRFLRLLDPEPSVEVSWEEGLDPSYRAGGVGGLFRRVVLDLSALPEGSTRLTLTLALPGRTAAVAERTIELSHGSADGP